MNNQFSTIFKTFLLMMICCTMIGHHWSWDEVCDIHGEGEGGISTNVDDVLNSDAKGHSYVFGQPPPWDCTQENNTDNRAYLGFYIITLITALIGFCCLVGETGEQIYAGCLTFLFFWFLIMEGLRVRQLHKDITDRFDHDDEVESNLARVYLSFAVSQFCLYCSLLVGLALELFDIPCCKCACACVKTVVVRQKAVVEI